MVNAAKTKGPSYCKSSIKHCQPATKPFPFSRQVHPSRGKTPLKCVEEGTEFIMLQRARIRPAAAMRFAATARPARALHFPPPPAGQPSQQHLRQQQRRLFHYDPNAAPRPRKTMRSRLFDYAVGSLLTVGGFVGWQYYRLQQLRSALELELGGRLQEYKDYYTGLEAGFQEARAAGDNDRLRELTFDVLRRAPAGENRFSVDGGPLIEVGPLPGLPQDDDMSGRELVPAEDTLVFIEKRQDTGKIFMMLVAVNLELDEIYRGMGDAPPREQDKLGELLRRVGDQVRMWEYQGRVLEGEDDGRPNLAVIFMLRDHHWIFQHQHGHIQHVYVGGLVEDTNDILEAEDLVAQHMGQKPKRGSR
ncbi:hypothetical protein BX600DRAFT_239450 [Xylariales sp. PMI_506]|nr:hypothetical protein BX600DRAFT_239450 [Xylariales sp. PMI_506]